MSEIDFLRNVGYPYKIKGNGGYTATLSGIQPLIDGFAALYRYPGGVCVHSLEEIQSGCGFEIIKQ